MNQVVHELHMNCSRTIHEQFHECSVRLGKSCSLLKVLASVLRFEIINSDKAVQDLFYTF